MGNFVSPAYGVRAVPIEKIVANSYNPVSYTHLDVYKRQALVQS